MPIHGTGLGQGAHYCRDAENSLALFLGAIFPLGVGILSGVDMDLLSLKTSAVGQEDVMLTAAVPGDAGKLEGLGSSSL